MKFTHVPHELLYNIHLHLRAKKATLIYTAVKYYDKR